MPPWRSPAAARRAVREPGPWLAALAALLILPHVPGLDSDYGRSLLTQMAIASVFALSFNLLFGQTGLLSFGHAVYFGLGGYAAIHFMRAINHGLPVPIVARAARRRRGRPLRRHRIRIGDDETRRERSSP